MFETNEFVNLLLFSYCKQKPKSIVNDLFWKSMFSWIQFNLVSALCMNEWIWKLVHVTRRFAAMRPFSHFIFTYSGMNEIWKLVHVTRRICGHAPLFSLHFSLIHKNERNRKLVHVHKENRGHAPLISLSFSIIEEWTTSKTCACSQGEFAVMHPFSHLSSLIRKWTKFEKILCMSQGESRSCTLFSRLQPHPHSFAGENIMRNFGSNFLKNFLDISSTFIWFG